MERYWLKTLARRASRRRVLATSTGLAAGAGLLAACGGGDSGSGAGPKDTSGLLTPPQDTTRSAKKGGTYKAVATSDVQSLDLLFTSAPTQTLANAIGSLLFRAKPGYLEPNKLEFQGDVVESFELSPDRLQLTLKLHPEARWGPLAPVNGRALDADDVLYSWRRFEAQATNRITLANSLNPDAAVVSLAATDARTIVMKLAAPEAALFSQLSVPNVGYLYMIPKEAESGAIDPRREMHGAGPFYLAEYQPSVRFVLKKSPSYTRDKDGRPFLDEVDLPIVTEYAQGMAQLRSGARYNYGSTGTSVRAEDVLPTKREVPDLRMTATDITVQSSRWFFGLAGNSPWLDERVRQAWSMTWDRDLFIEVVNNVSKFEAEGLPMVTAWNSTYQANIFPGWWLDPKGKELGENAKYYQKNIAEAKKLLAAAGHANGLEYKAIFTPTGYSLSYTQAKDIINGMAQEGGFRPVETPVNFNTEWRPQYVDNKGRFEGVATLTNLSPPDPGDNLYSHFNKGGARFNGYSADGKGVNLDGDPWMNEQTTKMRREFDEKKRIALAHEFQRYEAKKMYNPRSPGGANGFELVWPALQNWRVWQGDSQRIYASFWIDTTKPPFKAG